MLELQNTSRQNKLLDKATNTLVSQLTLTTQELTVKQLLEARRLQDMETELKRSLQG